MLFSSTSFVFFYLPLVLIGQALLPARLRLGFLFVVSLLFYGWGEPEAVWLMLLSILVAWGAALMMERHPRHKRAWLILSSALLLLTLGYFKYAGLLIPGFAVALPAGISFYTFQALAYCIDVYRGKIQAERSLLPFGTFISFFPQLIAGPIERYQDIRPQLQQLKLRPQELSEGARLFTIGLSKKLLLANPMGQLWQQLQQSPLENGLIGNWLGILAFAFQIYFDFSGYSDMARGLGRMLGIRLRKNFNYPYAARSITDFWRRWHMSLSSWFREYVYIPLGGNRRGLARQLLNILVVWGLTGLWHGAGYNFVLWGLYYALLLILEKLWLLKAYAALPGYLAVLPRVLTLALVLLGWVLFALTDFAALGLYLRAMFTGPLLPGTLALAAARSFVPLFALCVMASIPWKVRLPAWLENACLAALLLLCVAALVNQGYNPFLYFRF